jgi:hypothetical protein
MHAGSRMALALFSLVYSAEGDGAMCLRGPP